jgi:16S rRNA (cytosine967-C5)-methyltransferase
MASVSPARKAAFEILLEVERGRAHSDELLRSKRVSDLTPPDRNLATALVLGVLRWQIRLDQQIRVFLDRPNAHLDTEIAIALRLGAFQLLHMDRVPAHAALDESVELAKQAGHRFAARMVNAVLRKLAGATKSEGETEARVQAYPAWMVERWNRFYGPDGVLAVCVHGQEQPAAAVRVAGSEVLEELSAAGISLEAGNLLRAAWIVRAGDVTEIDGFREGRVRMQDEGSQLVAEVAGRGEMILDCCAAPGGKTLILAERNPAARIVACDSSAQRLAQLQKRLSPLGARVECRLEDAATLTDEGAFDLVLADVPCSGTGTLGRNPEIRHRLRMEDLARQAERQRTILRAALRAVRGGGRVVYSTCSLEPEENEDVVAAVLADERGVRVVPGKAVIAELQMRGILTDAGAERLTSGISSEGFLRLMPGALGPDGFFIAVIEKEKS